MKPLKFDEVNVILGEDQPEYENLPALVQGDKVVTCWELSEEEIEAIKNSKRIWMATLTFGQAFQPCLLTTQKEDVI